MRSNEQDFFPLLKLDLVISLCTEAKHSLVGSLEYEDRGDEKKLLTKIATLCCCQRFPGAGCAIAFQTSAYGYCTLR